MACAQSGAIEGRVIDSESGNPLIAATVLVDGETIGTSTDAEGYFILSELDTGHYYIEVSYLGYEMQTRLAVLTEPNTLTLDFGLLPLFTELNEVVVTATEEDFLNEPMPMTQITSTQIERLAATNTADLMEDIAGVSVARPVTGDLNPIYKA